MTLEISRGAPREGAPLSCAILAGCKLDNSDLIPEIQVPRAASLLARRFGLPAPTAALVATLAGFRGVAR